MLFSFFIAGRAFKRVIEISSPLNCQLFLPHSTSTKLLYNQTFGYPSFRSLKVAISESLSISYLDSCFETALRCNFIKVEEDALTSTVNHSLRLYYNAHPIILT